MKYRQWLFAGVTLTLVGACKDDAVNPVDPCERTEAAIAPITTPHTARWAFEPWISKDISDRADTYAYVDGFRERGIPVGAVVLDSPWETNYNTFVASPSRYGDLPGLIADMHGRNVKVVLWVTMFVNQSSLDLEPGSTPYDGEAPNLAEGQSCKYFVDDGAIFSWWKGTGAAIDFFDPRARAWWHSQQAPLLQAGLDGWKLDFGESYIREATLKTAAGVQPHQAYSEKYYEDYLEYGRSVRGNDFVTMVRAWDASYDLEPRFYAKKEHAPVAWMGDNRRDYVGLSDALEEMMISAKAGYAVLGSDIGGYLNVDDLNLTGPIIPFDSVNFARWTEIGALNPFMQLHSRGNFTPWTVPDHVEETTALYKYWATLHHALIPYLFSLTEETYAGGATPMRFLGGAGDYRYQLGDGLLVAPLLDETGKRSVQLDARSIDWWTRNEVTGTVAADFSNDRAKLPLYLREGAIIPMDIEDDLLGLGDASSKGARTVLIVPGAQKTTFKEHLDDGTIVTYDAVANGTSWNVGVTGAQVPTVFRVFEGNAKVTVKRVEPTAGRAEATSP